jgi:hypothetical protein
MTYCTQCGGIGCTQHSGDGPWCEHCGTLNRKCEYCRDREPIPHAVEILAARVLDQEQRLADLERVTRPLIEYAVRGYSSIYAYALHVAVDNKFLNAEDLRELCVTRGDDVDLTLSAQRVLRRTK